LMEWETFLWSLSLLVLGALIFLQVFELISFADLESDYINPIDLCSRINLFILPEVASHAILTALYLFSGFWFEFLLNLPLVVWHVHSFLNKKLNLDATSIFSSMDDAKKVSYIKLGFYMVTFFYYLYRLIYALVRDVVGSKEATHIVNNMMI